MRSGIRLSLFAALLAFSLGLVGCLNSEDDWKDSDLDFLVLKLESKYKREIDLNDYSIHYSKNPPAGVLISVTYYPTFNRTLLSSIVKAAKENAQHVAAEYYGIKPLGVEIDTTEVPLPPSRNKSP